MAWLAAMMKGEVEMKPACAMLAAIIIAMLPLPSLAVPPTVTPSPGYDARLQEQRSQATAVAPAAAAGAPASKAPRHHRKKTPVH